MTPAEFNEWLEVHGATFPTWGKQVAELPQRHLTLANWRVAMTSVSLDAARQVIAEMLEGAHGRTPYEPQAHVTLVIQRGKEIDAAANRREIRYADELRLRCSICMDEGIIAIVDPSSDPNELCRSAAWCGCPIGVDLAEAEQRQRDRRSSHVPASPAPIYDPDRHVRWRNDEERMREALGAIKPVNHQVEFDEWNQTMPTPRLAQTREQ